MNLMAELDAHAVAIAKLCNAQSYVEAGRLAAATVERIKSVIRENELKPEAEINDLFVRAVFFRSLFDFALLGHATLQAKWDEDHRVLDFVWTKYWDCKERFDYSRGAFGGLFVTFVAEFLDRLARYYEERFGRGWYLSAEILIRTRLCSICNNDIRRCDHVPGKLYCGRICHALARDIEPMGASLVENPHDPRCRIWPWNVDDEKRTITAPVLSVHQLDDFSDNSNWIQDSPKVTVTVALFETDFISEFFAGVRADNAPESLQA
jgi:hypothetical protein